MTRWHYRFSGIRITSDLELPEWAVFRQPSAFVEPDVVIATSICTQPPGTRKFRIVSQNEYHLFVPGAGEYRVRNGRDVSVAQAPDAGAREVRLFLLGSALGALLNQRGVLGLHASVVRTPAGAVAFCGPAGAGKSTLAAWLCTRGCGFVADDLTRFEAPDSGGALVYPSTPRLKLWRDAIVEMGLDESTMERDHMRADKFHLAATHDDPRSPVRLSAIYLLHWAGADVTIEQLHGLAGFRELVASASYQAGHSATVDQTAEHWQRCATLASRVPVHRFARPRDMAAAPDALDALVSHMSSLAGEPAYHTVAGALQ